MMPYSDFTTSVARGSKHGRTNMNINEDNQDYNTA